MRYSKFDKNVIYDLYVNKNYRVEDITKELGCSRTLVYARLREFGVQMPKKEGIGREELIKVIKENAEKSLEDIAIALNVSIWKLKEWAKLYGLDIGTKTKRIALKHGCSIKEAKRILERRQYHLHKERRLEWYRKYRKEMEQKSRLLRLKLIEKFGGQCQYCGFNNELALDFHHLKGKDTIKKPSWKRWKYIQDHQNDFLLLCANCHRILHRGNLAS